jgi:hypothetical protein
MKTDLSRFEMPAAEFLEILAERGITEIAPRGIAVQLDDGVRWFLPERGLNMHHFRYFAPLIDDHDIKDELAHAVMVNHLIPGRDLSEALFAVRQLRRETDLADALQEGGFNLLVERAERILIERESEWVEIGHQGKSGDRSGPYGGRLTYDATTKSVCLDDSSFVIEDPAAFGIFKMLFEAGGQIVTRRQLKNLPGCKGRVDRKIKNHLKEYNNKVLSYVIKSKVGRGGGYWITLPAELVRV